MYYTDPAQDLITAGQDLDLYYTDPAQHLITAGKDIDDLDRDNLDEV